jgi:hypothetical protein
MRGKPEDQIRIRRIEGLAGWIRIFRIEGLSGFNRRMGWQDWQHGQIRNLPTEGVEGK